MTGVVSNSSRSGTLHPVQRGDAEMSQKLWRVVRACVELGPDNPIEQIHDQGAGGNCNVVRGWCGLARWLPALQQPVSMPAYLLSQHVDLTRNPHSHAGQGNHLPAGR